MTRPPIDHPAAGRWAHLARDDNPDVGQRDAARADLARLAAGEPPGGPPPPPPTPEDLALRAHVTRRGCCGGGVTA